MRVGQPKLSERKIQRSGLFVPPTNFCSGLFEEMIITDAKQA
jgi:hypothetical protein